MRRCGKRTARTVVLTVSLAVCGELLDLWEVVMEIVYGLLGLVILDVSSLLWGADSREKLDSPEWGKRRFWRGFGGPTR